MNCENAFELISASLDGELTAAEEAQLRDHLAQCPACRALQAELAGLQEAAQAGLDAVAPPELKAAILENLPAQKSAGKVVYWRRWGAMAAAVALVVLAAWQLPRFVFDPVDGAPAADSPTAKTTEASADLPENPAVTFSYAKDSTESAGAIPNNDSADIDTASDAGATYGAATSKKQSTPAPAPASGTTAPIVNSAITNTAAPRAQSQPADTATPETKSEDAVEDTAPAQAESADADGADVADDLEAPIIATLTSGDAPSALSLPLPSDATDEAIPAPQSAPTGGAGGGGSPSVPEGGAVDGASVESRMAVLDAAPVPACWCGVLTLAEYEPAADYPMELTETGRRQYTLPAADFQALIETLDSEAAAYDLRTDGDDVSPDAPTGLVVVTGQSE